MLKDKLTLITPIRMTHPQHLEFFRQTMKSYYSIFGQDCPEHLVASANPFPYESEFIRIMDSYNAWNWKDVSHNTIPAKALNDMVKAVRTPYVHIVLADVCAVGTKNFLQLGVNALEYDKNICQMRYGDDPLSCSRPTNLSSFESDGYKIFFKGQPQFPFDPVLIPTLHPIDEGAIHFYDDVVWRYPMAAVAQTRFIGFALWPCTYRTEVLLRVVNEVEKRMNQGVRTLADWMAVVNRRPDFCNWDLPQKGWPEGFEFLEPLKQGTLNMACYMFALGREQKTWGEFIKTSTIEVKAVPPKGELYSGGPQ